MLIYCLLTCIFSNEKFPVIFIFLPPYITYYFALAVLKIFSQENMVLNKTRFCAYWWCSFNPVFSCFLHLSSLDLTSIAFIKFGKLLAISSNIFAPFISFKDQFHIYSIVCSCPAARWYSVHFLNSLFSQLDSLWTVSISMSLSLKIFSSAMSNLPLITYSVCVI